MNFQPTYLYIKQHSVTKKCYFGKTCSKDPIKYPGSGTHWKRHIKIHGKEFIETLWFKLFVDKAECTRVALLFSEQQDIVKSEIWLNLKKEDGLEGGSTKGYKLSTEARMRLIGRGKGIPHTEEAKAKMSISQKGKTRSAEFCTKVSISNKGRIISQETRDKISSAQKGKTFSESHLENIRIAGEKRRGTKVSAEQIEKTAAKLRGKKQRTTTCPHCNITGSISLLGRYHFNKCPTYTGVSRPPSSQRRVKCTYCDKEGGVANMTRFHFDKCKQKPND